MLLLVVIATPVAGDQSRSRSRRGHGDNDVIDDDGKFCTARADFVISDVFTKYCDDFRIVHGSGPTVGRVGSGQRKVTHVQH